MEIIIYFQLYLLYYLFTNSSLPCFVILDWTLQATRLHSQWGHVRFCQQRVLEGDYRAKREKGIFFSPLQCLVFLQVSQVDQQAEGHGRLQHSSFPGFEASALQPVSSSPQQQATHSYNKHTLSSEACISALWHSLFLNF